MTKHPDLEWENAEKEGPVKTWWVIYGDCKFIKCYTEALAEVVRKRTGWIIIPFNK